MAYSIDKAHIAIARQCYDVITVLDFLLGTPQQVIKTDMQIEDIKVIDHTIFVTDRHELVSWELEAVGTVHCGYSSRRVINLFFNLYPKGLILSHDCSQIAHANGKIISMYNVQVQKTLQYKEYKGSNLWVKDIQFSPSGHQLWFFGNPYHSKALYLKKLGMENDWDEQLSYYSEEEWSSLEGDCSEDKLLLPTVDHLENEWSWVNLFSYGYHVQMGSGWITNSRGSKLLWLPLAWRTQNWREVRWDGKFLALLGGHHPTPIIIEFQPQPAPPHPLGA